MLTNIFQWAWLIQILCTYEGSQPGPAIVCIITTPIEFLNIFRPLPTTPCGNEANFVYHSKWCNYFVNNVTLFINYLRLRSSKYIFKLLRLSCLVSSFLFSLHVRDSKISGDVGKHFSASYFIAKK